MKSVTETDHNPSESSLLGCRHRASTSRCDAGTAPKTIDHPDYGHVVNRLSINPVDESVHFYDIGNPAKPDLVHEPCRKAECPESQTILQY